MPIFTMIAIFISFIPTIIFHDGNILAVGMFIGVTADLIFIIICEVKDNLHDNKDEDDSYYSKD